MAEQSKIYIDLDYEDPYVQPLILSALKSRLPSELLVFVQNEENKETPAKFPDGNSKLLQWRQYESIDFDRLLDQPSTTLANSYVIRKALMRKHYLSTTIAHWITKNPDSVLTRHVKPSVEFEVDFAEFLDEALLEAFELHEFWARNAGKPPHEREWWILKPGMSDRGQGIRLFSSEEELQGIFKEWDPPSDDEEEEEDDEEGEGCFSGDEKDAPDGPTSLANGEKNTSIETSNEGGDGRGGDDEDEGNGIITSQLRHFIAQPYIHPPLLLPPPHPCAGKKFHIRTYVLAVGALKVYVYKPMLALFAAKPYSAPGSSSPYSSPDRNPESQGDPSPSSAKGIPTDVNADLTGHLSNTCFHLDPSTRESSVHAFWSLPSSLSSSSSSPPNSETSPNQEDWKESLFTQIQSITAQTFLAAARTMSIHFQPLPNAFEIFGVDFLVDATEGKAWLMEINAFPDFAQTGAELKEDLVGGLFEEVVELVVRPFFFGDDGEEGTGKGEQGERGNGRMVKCLDVDLGRG
ncbi:TTL-domain-containing protein [Hortaea werneckii]|nr:TTL-domain-containing protein [Hortaea werneckii]